MKHHVVTAALLLAALALYAAGVSAGSALLLVLAMVCEGGFWVHLLRSRKQPATADSDLRQAD